MGFGLPAAIGAALATGEPALCVTGDGSLMLCIHELSTLAELDLDVCVLVLDNGHLGLVRQQQTLFYGDRRVAARFERGPDLVAAARALGVHACTLDGAPDPLERLVQGLRRSGPRLIHVPVDAAELVLPMVAPGGGNLEMVLQPPAEAAAAATGTQPANSKA
jgi:acetolactate synthase-1/2/3 large subunit